LATCGAMFSMMCTEVVKCKLLLLGESFG
jgi:hypothetical protein